MRCDQKFETEDLHFLNSKFENFNRDMCIAKQLTW